MRFPNLVWSIAQRWLFKEPHPPTSIHRVEVTA